MSRRRRDPDRLARIEARLAVLESRRDATRPAAAPQPDPRRYWLLRRLRDRARLAAPHERGQGRVGAAGIVHTGDDHHYEWQVERTVGGLVTTDWNDFARPLAALGAPIRLELLRTMLAGVCDATVLARLPGMGTTGRLYHHLNELQAAGWIRHQQRSRYELVPDRVVALMIVLATLAGREPAAAAGAVPPRRVTPVARTRRRQ